LTGDFVVCWRATSGQIEAPDAALLKAADGNLGFDHRRNNQTFRVEIISPSTYK